MTGRSSGADQRVRVGIDVGGTNTDAVIMQGSTVLASIKAPTSQDIQKGVADAARLVMKKAGVSARAVDQVMIGTTQFTNAFVERKRITPVAVIRLGLPATRSIRPCVDWPRDLLDAVNIKVFFVDGGHEFDGREISPLCHEQLEGVISEIRDLGYEAVAVTGVFSPVDKSMEDRIAELLREAIPGIHISLSNEIGRLGLIERENATIMNASLSVFANRVIDGFRQALGDLDITAPFFVSQNDGTLMNEEFVRRYPVLTFASGPTNSMRGAAYLTAREESIIVDIGGTTTDVGVLVNGFPRESSIPVDIGGVRTNFRMPDILSVGLGGGSIVRQRDDGSVTIGPDSVGYRLTEDALVFGGQTTTATDIVVAAGRCVVGEPALVEHLDKNFVKQAENLIHAMVENAIDRMKTQNDDVPVVLVGGGSVLVNRKLSGASEMTIPDNFGVANAIGAGMAQIGSEVDRIFSYADLGRDKALAEAKNEAVTGCIDAGGAPDSVKIIDVEELPLTYLPGGAVRVRVKAVGDLLNG